MPAKLTGTRAALAAAIEHVATLTAERDELDQAAWRLPPGLIDAQEEAETRLKDARQRERQPSTVLARAKGQPVAGPTLAEAQAALDKANADIAQAQEHCRAIAAIVPRAASDLDVATGRRDKLIAEVVREDAGTKALLAEMSALEQRIATVRACLAKLPTTALPLNVFYVRDPKPDADVVKATADWVTALRHTAEATCPHFDSPPAPEQAEAA